MKPLLRLVTMMEILLVNAEAFWRLSSVLGQTLIRLESPLKDEAFGIIGATLGELQGEVERLNLQYSAIQLKRIRQEVDDNTVTSASLRQNIKELHLRMIDELENRFFLAVPPESAEYFSQPTPLFGGDVETKFPQMSEDISEAGKCLALHRPTAAVFHLMRAAEIAVQHFGGILGVTFAAEKNWQSILNQINKAIRNLDQKEKKTKLYAEIASHLYHVKLAWRNEVMHPKQTYTLDEAETIFNAAKTFICELAVTL